MNWNEPRWLYVYENMKYRLNNFQNWFKIVWKKNCIWAAVHSVIELHVQLGTLFSATQIDFLCQSYCSILIYNFSICASVLAYVDLIFWFLKNWNSNFDSKQKNQEKPNCNKVQQKCVTSNKAVTQTMNDVNKQKCAHLLEHQHSIRLVVRCIWIVFLVFDLDSVKEVNHNS